MLAYVLVNINNFFMLIPYYNTCSNHIFICICNCGTTLLSENNLNSLRNQNKIEELFFLQIQIP